MTDRVLPIILALILSCPFFSVAQEQGSGVKHMEGAFLRPLQERDSVLIADQLRYGVSLKGIDKGVSLAFPDFSEGLMDNVEVVAPWLLDTVKVHKGRKNAAESYDIEASVVITSFEEGSYQLPPLSVLMQSDVRVDTLVFDSILLDVKTMPVDTATFAIHDIKGQIRYPVTFRELIPYMIGIILLAILTAVICYLVRKYRRRASAGADPDEPAHITALRKLDQYRGNKFWAPDKQKMFYSGITDALREYIVARYGVEAMEMTTSEIFNALTDKEIPNELFDDLKGLFETSDYVKFAKLTVSDDDNAKALPLAIRFVTSTYQTIIDTEADKASAAKDDEK